MENGIIDATERGAGLAEIGESGGGGSVFHITFIFAVFWGRRDLSHAPAHAQPASLNPPPDYRRLGAWPPIIRWSPSITSGNGPVFLPGIVRRTICPRHAPAAFHRG